MCDLHRGTRLYLNLGQRLVCDVYMDATYTRVITVPGYFLYVSVYNIF